MKKILLVIILTFMLSMAFDPSLFIMKTYNNQKPEPRQCHAMGNYTDQRNEKYAFDSICKLLYINWTPKGSIFNEVMIRIIKDQQAAADWMAVRLIGTMNRDYQSASKYMGMSQVSFATLAYKQQVIWISASYLIHIRDELQPIPDQMLKDYLAKYPPTRKLNQNDLNPEQIVKRQMKNDLKMIRAQENDRGFINNLVSKEDVFIAAATQCDLEMVLRCEIGLTDSQGQVSCPVALELDADSRLTGWDRLEQNITKLPVKLDNVEWPPNRSKCKSSLKYGVEDEVAKKIGFDDRNLSHRTKPYVRP